MNSNIENAGLKKLKEAFREINEWEYENLHLDTLEEVIPSTRYRKRMERLIRRQKQPYWKYVNTVGKRVAVFAVAIALVFALSMSVSAVREPVVEFFANVYEKFVEFFYEELYTDFTDIIFVTDGSLNLSNKLPLCGSINY